MTTADPHRLFDDLVERYEAWYETPRGRALLAGEVACLRPLLRRLPGPQLEVGVGTGRFAEALGVGYGIDPASRPLARAAARGVNTARALGEDLPFPDGVFGGVLIALTLCFVRDPVRVLQEAHRVVRPGGGLVLGLLPGDTAWASVYTERGRAGDPMYAAARFHSPAEVATMLAASGWMPVAWRSTLFSPPESVPQAPVEARDGLIPDAGFVAWATRKATPCWR